MLRPGGVSLLAVCVQGDVEDAIERETARAVSANLCPLLADE